MNSGGDKLARGAASAQFPSPRVSQEKYDWTFLSDEEFQAKYSFTKDEWESRK